MPANLPIPAATFVQLRDAIIQANQSDDPDIIQIPANTTITLSAVLPPIHHALSIQGAGMSSIIQGTGSTINPTPEPAPGRLFSVLPKPGVPEVAFGVDFQNLVLARGEARGQNGYGGAIFVDADVIMYVANVRFEENRAEKEGGAIYVERQGNLIIIENSEHERNSAGEKGGAIASWGKLSIEESTFTSNSSGENGGALYLYRTAPNVPHLIKATTFFSNQAKQHGGAIFLDSGAPLDIKDSSFQNNSAGRMPTSTIGSGGAIYTQNSTLLVHNTGFVNNSSATGGGAILVDGQSAVAVFHSGFALNKSGTPLLPDSVYIKLGGTYLDDPFTFYADMIPFWEQ